MRTCGRSLSTLGSTLTIRILPSLSIRSMGRAKGESRVSALHELIICVACGPDCLPYMQDRVHRVPQSRKCDDTEELV